MASPADPIAALNMFQRDLGQLTLRRSQTDPKLLFVLDQPNGVSRLTFVRLDGHAVTAMAVFFASQATEDTLTFHAFYAVPEGYRNQGRAKDVLGAALRQIEHGFPGVNVRTIRVEVTVDAQNTAGQKVAAATISPDPTPVIDEVSGRPAFRYGATLTRPVS